MPSRHERRLDIFLRTAGSLIAISLRAITQTSLFMKSLDVADSTVKCNMDKGIEERSQAA